MDHSRYSKFKSGALLLALLTMSACSSSQVDDASAPPETVGDVAAAPDANTDSVPVGEDPALAQQPAPGALDANGGTPPAGDPNAVGDANSAPPEAGDPAAASAALDAPPGGDPMAAANTEAPPADAPVSNVPVDNSYQSTPDTSVASATPDTSVDSGEGVHYKVKRGDTLMKIAFENYGDLYRWKEIYEANRTHIQDPNHVPPGTQLTLNGAGMVTIDRNGESYLIKHGDTLGVISNDVYGTTHKWKKLWENNRQLIKDPNKIYAGFYLYYHPEARLTHDDEAPTDGGSAANTPKNLPFKNQAAQPVQTAKNTAVAPVQVQPAQTAVQAAGGARVPASNK